MNTGFLESTLNLHNDVLRRKYVVQEKLDQFGLKGDESRNIPRCVLKTELDRLNELSATLEKEVWYINDQHSDLARTYDGMISPDWKERLKSEWAQLCIRMERLDNFRDAFRKDDHGFVSKWDERLLCDQLRAMRNYRDCLMQYAKMEGVELDMSLYDDSYIYDYYFAKDDKED